MATSATSTSNLTAQDIIDLALTDIGVLGQSGGTSDPDVRVQALKVLQILLKGLDAEGLLTWKVVRKTQTLTAGTASYAISNEISDIDQPARYTQVGATYGSQVQSMVRDEYMVLPDRTIQGISYMYYVEKSLDAAGIEFITLFLFPVPANTGDTLEYAGAVRIRDITNISQTLDIPQKWLNAIRWSLAYNLGPSYGVPSDKMAILKKCMDDSMEKAIGDDNERGDMQFVPWSNSSGYAYRSWSR